MFIDELTDMLRLEKRVQKLTDEVRVLCVKRCGLYIEVRLLGSKLDVAKLTLADSVV
jgi:hypothetical protein